MPPTVGLRIDYSDTLSSHNFAEAGLVKANDAWQTPDYAAAADRIDLRLSANVSSVNLDRSGDCQ